jgi:hypothetical protein
MSGQPYTDADEELVALEIAEGWGWEDDAARWRPPAEQDVYDEGYAQGREDAAQAIEAHDGPLTDGPRTTLARIAREHREAGHG